ncbi:MAG: hypothetical protein WCX97_01490 [Candidatus Magasanikbacteria bacterium]
MAEKKYWRCLVCGDLHYGVEAPEKCPTCGQPRTQAEEITKEQFMTILG